MVLPLDGAFLGACIAVCPGRRGHLRVTATLACSKQALPLYLGVFAVPGGGLLKRAAGLEDGGVVSGAADELEADGEIFFGEAAGN